MIPDPDWEYVYIVERSGRWKIGHSWDPYRRAQGLKGRLVFLRRMKYPHASRVERMTRWAMAKHLIPELGREWFSADPSKAASKILRQRDYRRRPIR